MQRPLRAWLQLVRAPNLFTVGGDPLAGFLLSNFGIPTQEVFAPLSASLCFYAAGLIDNDLADLSEDRRERPFRPLPSGAIPTKTAVIALILLALLGLSLCAGAGLHCLLTALALLATVLAYNHFLKHLPFLGALSMGLCRALSLLLGASAAPSGVIPNETLLAALCITLWIASITHLARFETLPTIPSHARWMPPCAMAAVLAITLRWNPMGTSPWLLCASLALHSLLFLAFLLSLRSVSRILRPTPLPPTIGSLIRLLLPMQAAFCAITGLFGIIAGSLLLLLWPVSRQVSKKFYAS
jgi:hypothetical protein